MIYGIASHSHCPQVNLQNHFGCFGNNGQNPDSFSGNTGIFASCQAPGNDITCPTQCPVQNGYCSLGNTSTTTAPPTGNNCPTCMALLQGQISSGLKAGGGVGLAFAFIEVCHTRSSAFQPTCPPQLVGVACAWKVRKDQVASASANYRAFL